METDLRAARALSLVLVAMAFALLVAVRGTQRPRAAERPERA
jgi:ABC-type sulfate transport system permease component